MKRTMPRLALVVSVLTFCLAASPVVAQTPTPSGSVISEVANAAQTLGVVSVIAVVAVFILLVAVSALFVGVYRLGKPLVDTTTSANARNDTLTQELSRTNEASRRAGKRNLAIQARMADTLRRTGDILSALETASQAAEGRNSAVKTITDHVDTVIKPVDGKLDTVVQTLEEVKASMVTSKRLDDIVNPLIKRIDDALTSIRDLQQNGVIVSKGDTGPLDGSKVPDAPPVNSEKKET